MNAQKFFWLFLLLVFITACKEETYIYEVNDILIEANNAGKTKRKTPEQFLNIAYANLYQKALSPSELVDLSNIVASIGDKQVAYETIIAKMMNDPEVILPSTQSMRGNLSAFITATYKRFYIRNPTESERTWWMNYLETHINLTAEHVYFSFATSNEYAFY